MQDLLKELNQAIETIEEGGKEEREKTQQQIVRLKDLFEKAKEKGRKIVVRTSKYALLIKNKGVNQELFFWTKTEKGRWKLASSFNKESDEFTRKGMLISVTIWRVVQQLVEEEGMAIVE